MTPSSPNPYAPPKSAVADGLPGHCTRQGKFVIVPAGSDLPPRCIHCNAPAVLPVKKKKVYWHSPWIFLLLLLNVLLYLIVGLITRRSFQVSPGLCETHAAARRRRIGLWLGGGVLALGAGWLLLEYQQDLGSGLAFALALVLFIGAAVATRTVYPKEITKTHARLAGCKEPFLASLD